MPQPQSKSNRDASSFLSSWYFLVRHLLTPRAQVRCDAASLGVPCTNCVAFSIECKIPTPKRKKAQKKGKESDRSVYTMVQRFRHCYADCRPTIVSRMKYLQTTSDPHSSHLKRAPSNSDSRGHPSVMLRSLLMPGQSPRLWRRRPRMPSRINS